MLEEFARDLLFRKNDEGDRRVWVDRGIDGRLDDFQVCRPCRDALIEDDPLGQHWHDEKRLCLDCRTEFDARALAVDLFGLRRPFNGMLLEDRVLTNDELYANPRLSAPGAFDYFLPEPGDGFMPDPIAAFQPNQGDGFLLDPGDSLRPGHGVAFTHGPSDGFPPDRGDSFLPNPGHYFLPGMEAYFLPDQPEWDML
ncbi:MAG: hypothetical protein IT365_04440 [Candidatus Hydrogenedentes bacterium]|nr:hypothetical protein [Candidatus Hydrogenedentota bacterium]